MKRVLHLIAVFLVAGVALMILAGAVYSSPQLNHNRHTPARPDYAYTRIVTITVYSSTVALTPGLISLWQFRTLDQVLAYTFDIPLPSDAYEISVALPITYYRIDPGPTLIITGPQTDLYYEYKTGQRALRFGNQILITQAASNNQPYRYLGTLTFADPYTYVGTSGFAPTVTTPGAISWDVIPEVDSEQRYRFNASTWLWDPRLVPPVLARPDLEIFTATVRGQNDHIYVTATIRNNGPMTAWAPPYINLYDRVAPFLPPAGPLDLTDGWCSMMPESSCGFSATNPLSPVSPGKTVIFTVEHDLSPVNGRHDIYLLIDALGGSQGLNVESAENNNVILAATLLRLGERTFLPLIRR